MGRRRSQAQAIFAGQGDHVAAKLLDFFFGFFDIAADRGPDFDHRLVHLGLDPLLQEQFALLDNLGVNVRAQVARDRIDGLVFLFNPDGESSEAWPAFLKAGTLVPAIIR